MESCVLGEFLYFQMKIIGNKSTHNLVETFNGAVVKCTCAVRVLVPYFGERHWNQMQHWNACKEIIRLVGYMIFHYTVKPLFSRTFYWRFWIYADFWYTKLGELLTPKTRGRWEFSLALTRQRPLYTPSVSTPAWRAHSKHINVVHVCFEIIEGGFLRGFLFFAGVSGP